MCRSSDTDSSHPCAGKGPPDVVVLDLGLPDIDGVAVLDGLRAWCTAPVIVLSARHAEPAKVAALDAGADDYVTKPFGMDELLARVRAALRRAVPTPASPWSPQTHSPSTSPPERSSHHTATCA